MQDELDMKDLRRKVAGLLKDTLDGREVDTMQSIEPRLPHMLGFTPIGEPVDPNDLEGTIIDVRNEFWDHYYKDVATRGAARDEVIDAIESLASDNLFRKTYPHGEEAGLVYIEVDDPAQYRLDADDGSMVACPSCGESLVVSLTRGADDE